MADDDRRLRELYAGTTALPRTDHPSDAEWEALALGELPPARREALADHATRCAECALVQRGLGMLARDAAAFDPGVPRAVAPRATAVPARWVYGGLAAAAAVVLVLLLPGRPGPQPGPPPSLDPVRSAPRAAPVALTPSGPLTEAPRAFRWQAIPDARRYRVELSSAEGDRLWTSPPLQGDTTPWPTDVPAAPGVYHWLVVALPEAGRPLSSPAPSELVTFEIPRR